MPEPERKQLSTPRRRGRRALQLLYWALVVGVASTGAVQVTLQVFFPPKEVPPYAKCQDGLRALNEAIGRARAAAPGPGGEQGALDRFRAALAPEWRFRDGITELCRDSEAHEGALDAIERLRYAEEHAARREAGDLAPLRRHVQAIVDGEAEGAPR